MEKIYRDADVDMSILNGKTIAVIGYGIQGKAQAANARDSGWPGHHRHATARRKWLARSSDQGWLRSDEYRRRHEKGGYFANRIG